MWSGRYSRSHRRQRHLSSTLEGSTRSAAFWMGINTLVTVGICTPSDLLNKNFVMPSTDYWCTGLCQQGHILRPNVEANANLIRGLSLCSHMVGSVRDVSASNWHVHLQETVNHTVHPSDYCHVSERHPHKPLSCIFDHHVLPSCSNTPYTNSDVYELRPV
jgi:hypothetical protein